MKKQDEQKKTAPPLFCLFTTFLKISAFTFGGGYAMISVISHEVTEKRRWLSREEFLDVVAVSESTPGPLAINAATFIGTKVGGFWGAICATLGVVLPPFVIISILSFVLDQIKGIVYVDYAFFGVRAAVIALLLNAVLSLSKVCRKDIFFWTTAPLALLACLITQIPVIVLLLLGALAGLLAKKGASDT